MNWDNQPYFSLNTYLRQTFGEKIYKLSLDGGMTCPNRDKTLGTEGCIFCSQGGSGDFSVSRKGGISAESIDQQLTLAKKKISGKFQNGRYIAYFQAYTNTYAPVEYLERLFTHALDHPDIAALSIATRPDCLGKDVILLLKRLNKKKPVWIELGLQTIHEETARLIRRSYELPCFDQACQHLREAGLTIIVHVILGLPGEDKPMMLETVRYLGNQHIDGIKLQLLHVLKNTDLDSMYKSQPFPIMSMEEYADLVVDCIASLPPDIVIHRISGDGPKALLTAPLWSANKRLVLNTITRRFRERSCYQGQFWEPAVELTVPSSSNVTAKEILSIYR